MATCAAEMHCYCELHSCLIKVEELAKLDIAGIVLSGGPRLVIVCLCLCVSACLVFSLCVCL